MTRPKRRQRHQSAKPRSLMTQYRDAKAKHPDMLLLFRVGDFFELFDGDAETAAKVLGLTLTATATPKSRKPRPRPAQRIHLTIAADGPAPAVVEITVGKQEAA